MELKKGKYKKAEVEAILTDVDKENSCVIDEKNALIADLKSQLFELNDLLKGYKEREDVIKNAVISATQKAEEIQKTAENKYAAELERLKLFQFKWNSYFKYLLETYPNYSVTQKTEQIRAKLLEIFKDSSNAIDKVNGLEAIIKDEVAITKLPFDPKSKIDRYILNDSDSGFDMNEVLNPKEELNLEDLCKELGLMDLK